MKDYLDTVRKLVPECTVLLKKDGLFPLKEPCDISVFGSGIRHTIKGGTGSGEVNSKEEITIEEALIKAGFKITTTDYLNAYDQRLIEAKQEFIKQVKQEARQAHQMVLTYGMGRSMLEPEHTISLPVNSEVAIFVLSRNSGEGSDRQAIKGDVFLTDSEIRDILFLNEHYHKFMLVLNTGGVVDLSPVKDVKNILVLSQLGVVTGDVLSDILLGKVSPSGKLSTTWAKYEDYPTIGEFGEFDDTRYKEGIYVGYRYFDTVKQQPLFPFGYGLTYSSFSISNETFDIDEEIIKISAKIENTGDFPAKEVLQVYVSVPSVTLDQPYQVLAGFVKTDTILPKNTQTITTKFKITDLESYDAKSEAYILEPGDYVIRVGNASDNTKVIGVITLEERIITKQVKNCLGCSDFKDYSPTVCKEEYDVKKVIFKHNIQTIKTQYDQSYEVHPLIKSLSDDELLYMNIGGFNPHAKGLSIIGNASESVAGAAGQTTKELESKGIPSIIMSDGPAGLRLAKDYFIDENGKANGIGVSIMPDSMNDFLSKPMKLMMDIFIGTGKKPKGNQEILHHYATAIPIGTAVAQSWNVSLAETLGDIVGSEMEAFGIHLWLAPALNIHRNILCGRNFEYYSEDPLISGKIAAGITRGVQRHKRCGVTIKHFAFNNQETNRYGSNSIMSERTARDLYLKGFEICIKEAKPVALMTSYNLINGIHTSEHRGLIENILRCEYGFKGIVMTDWIIGMATSNKAIHRNSLSPYVISAGGDLFMPGGKGDFKKAKEGLKSGIISRKQLEINATRVYSTIQLLKK